MRKSTKDALDTLILIVGLVVGGAVGWWILQQMAAWGRSIP